MRQDFLHALRLFRLNPGFAAMVIAIVALGIGANTAMFSIIDAVVLKPLPFAEPERLTILWETRPDRGFANNVVSGSNYLQWRERNKSFDAMSAMAFRTATLGGVGDPEQVRSQLVGDEFFPMLGVRMAMGRGFTAAETKVGGEPVVILGDTLWRRKFGADPAVVGKTIRVNGEAATVIGVAPAGMLTISDKPPELWQPLRIPPGSSGRNFVVLARLRPGVRVEQADVEVRGMAKQLAAEFPQFNANWSAKAVPLDVEMYGKVQAPLFVLLGAVGMILLIACANVGNLMLARALGRQREMAIRAALGAGQGRLIRQSLLESLSLSAVGGFAGIGLAYLLIGAARQFGPEELRRLDRASIDGTVLLFTVAIVLVTGLLLGLAPALLAGRRSLGMAMRDGGRGASSGRQAGLLRDVFTVAQVAMALMLLVGAGLLLRSFAKVTAVEPGFRTDHVLTMNLSTPGTRYRDGQGERFFAQLRREVSTLPGVEDASVITFLPFKGSGSGTYFWRAERGQPAAGQEPVTDVRMVQPRYFETMRIPLRQGRTFVEADNDSKAPLRFMINESMARQMFPGEDPVGRRLVVQMARVNPPGEIVGVVGDVKHGSLTDKVRPMVYYPQAQLFFGFGTLVVASSGEPLSLAKAVTDVVRRLDAEMPVSEVGTMQRWVDESLQRTRFQTGLLAVFAALALALAVLGIYAVMSYGVGQRTKEIGIRMALGAGRGRVAGMILSRGLVLGLIGAVLGLGGAGLLGRYLKTLLFEIEPGDPVTRAAVTVLILVVAVVAALAPAGRATKVDPMVVLRYE